MSDPTEDLAALSATATSLSQALHHAGAAYDGQPSCQARSHIDADHRATRYQLSWELHRAGEMLRQVARSLEQAQELEATLTRRPGSPSQCLPAAAPPSLGLSL